MKTEELEYIKRDLYYIGEILKNGDSLTVENDFVGFISVDKGNIGKSGNGLQHIIEQRFEKDSKSVEEISAVLSLVMDATERGIVSRNTKVFQNEVDIGTYDLERNGIISFVSKTRDGKDEKFVITGFDDFSKKNEAGDAIKAVIAENSYAPEFVIVKEQVVATLASSFILHLNEINRNLELNNKKRALQEINKLENYITCEELHNYFRDKNNIKKNLEMTDAINVINTNLGNKEEFILVAEKMGAVFSNNNQSSDNEVELLKKENERLRKENLELGKQIMSITVQQMKNKRQILNKNKPKFKDDDYGHSRSKQEERKMRKLKAIILALTLGCAETSVFAQGYPVIDVANLMQSIESVYQYYQQIQQTIEQVQNTYKQIEQAAQQMASMNWDDLKNLGDNFSGMGDNPFEVITGVRNSAQDITKAVNKNMNKINDFQDSLTKKSISFGGQQVSMADLCGAGDPGDNIFGFVKNAWEYTTDTEDGAFSDAVKAYTGKLTYRQKQAIMRKYGMSPKNYATLELANHELSELMKSSNLKGTIEYQTQILTEAENDANAIQKLAREMPDGSIFAATQLVNSGIATTIRSLGKLEQSLASGFGTISQYFSSQKTKEAMQQQEDYENKTETEINSTGSAISAMDDD